MSNCAHIDNQTSGRIQNQHLYVGNDSNFFDTLYKRAHTHNKLTNQDTTSTEGQQAQHARSSTRLSSRASIPIEVLAR